MTLDSQWIQKQKPLLRNETTAPDEHHRQRRKRLSELCRIWRAADGLPSNVTTVCCSSIVEDFPLRRSALFQQVIHQTCSQNSSAICQRSPASCSTILQLFTGFCYILFRSSTGVAETSFNESWTDFPVRLACSFRLLDGTLDAFFSFFSQILGCLRPSPASLSASLTFSAALPRFFIDIFTDTLAQAVSSRNLKVVGSTPTPGYVGFGFWCLFGFSRACVFLVVTPRVSIETWDFHSELILVSHWDLLSNMVIILIYLSQAHICSQINGHHGSVFTNCIVKIIILY